MDKCSSATVCHSWSGPWPVTICSIYDDCIFSKPPYEVHLAIKSVSAYFGTSIMNKVSNGSYSLFMKKNFDL